MIKIATNCKGVYVMIRRTTVEIGKKLTSSAKILARQRTLKSKLLLSYLLILALPVAIIGTASYRKASQSLENEVKKYTAQVLVQVSSGVDSLVNQMNRMALVINADPEVLRILKPAARPKDGNVIRDYRQVQQIIENATLLMPEIVGFSVFTTDGRNFSMSSKSVRLGYDFRSEPWFQILQRRNSCFLPAHYQSQVLEASSEKVVSLVKVVKDPSSYRTIGYVLIDCKTRALENILGNQSGLQHSSTFILSPKGALVFASNAGVCNFATVRRALQKIKSHRDLNFTILKAQQRQILITCYTSPYTEWQVINANSIDSINRSIANIQGYTIFIVLVSAGLTFIISCFLALSITNPLRRLKEKMKAFEKGDFEVAVGLESADEIGELGRSFDSMASKVHEMIKKVYQAELTKKEAELCALQAQINPHFLYNTLAVIDSMALVKGNQEISDICCALSKIFRYNVTRGEFSTFGEELEQIKLYLLIQKARYRDRLDYTITMAPELATCRILKLLIQPVVENAVVHGLEGKRGPVKVEIKVTCVPVQSIIIMIRDDGRGMTADALQGLLQELESTQTLYWQKEPAGRSHVGLKNVNYRIKTHYGAAYGLDITSAPHTGTVVTMTVPRVEKE